MMVSFGLLRRPEPARRNISMGSKALHFHQQLLIEDISVCKLRFHMLLDGLHQQETRIVSEISGRFFGICFEPAIVAMSFTASLCRLTAAPKFPSNRSYSGFRLYLSMLDEENTTVGTESSEHTEASLTLPLNGRVTCH